MTKHFSERFEEFMRATRDDGGDWRPHIIAVADTMYVCKIWLESYTEGHIPADVIAMAKLVLEHERYAKPLD
jgi:hypothetical protein